MHAGRFGSSINVMSSYALENFDSVKKIVMECPLMNNIGTGAGAGVVAGHTDNYPIGPDHRSQLLGAVKYQVRVLGQDLEVFARRGLTLHGVDHHEFVGRALRPQ